MTSNTTAPEVRRVLNKVPRIVVWFWVVKVLATTVGETIADWLTGTVGLSLVAAAAVVGVVLVGTLAVQLRASRYLAPVYWSAVVLVSVVGTLVSDHLVDDLGVPLWVTTAVFAVALAAVFALWYRSERTLSIHTITTTRRELFYWLAVLCTFALGTSGGDLVAEQSGLGYAASALLFAAAIAVVGLAHRWRLVGPVLAFWAAYVLTRPLGASLGDLLSQSRSDGGLGLGTTVTSAVFVAAIAVIVTYLTITKKDVEQVAAETPPSPVAVMLVEPEEPALEA